MFCDSDCQSSPSELVRGGRPCLCFGLKNPRRLRAKVSLPKSIQRRAITYVRSTTVITLAGTSLAVALFIGCVNETPADTVRSAAPVLSPKPSIVEEPIPTSEPVLETETPARMPEPVADQTVEPSPSSRPTPELPTSTESPVPASEPIVKPTVVPSPVPIPTPELTRATESVAPTPEPVADPTVEPTPSSPPTPELPTATESRVPTPEPIVKSTVGPTPTPPSVPETLATETPAPTPEPVVEPTVEPTPAPEPPPPTPIATAINDERVVVEPDAEIETGCLNTRDGQSRTYIPRGEAPSRLLTAVEQLQWVKDADPDSAAFDSAQYLEVIAGYAPEVLEALLERHWLTNYGDPTADRYKSTYPLLVRLIELVRRDKDIALQTVRHPIFDTLDWGETSLTDFITDLTWSDPEGLHAQMQFLDLIDASQSSTDSHLGFLYLQAEFPGVAQEVAALPWVEDGLEMNEIDVLFAIARLAARSPESIQNILEADVTLLQQPTNQSHAYALEDLVTLSTVSQEATQFLTRRNFLDSTVFEYYKLVKEIEQLARQNPEFLCHMLDNPVFSAGDNSSLIAELPLIVLDATLPDAAEEIRAIPWVADGIRPLPSDSDGYSYSSPMVFEAQFVQDFVRTQRSSPNFLSQLIKHTWLRDGFSPVEVQVFYDVIDVGGRDEQAGLAILELPVYDPVNSESHAVVYSLKELIWQGASALSQVLYDPSVRAASRDELPVAIRRSQLELEKPNILSSIDSLPWVNDDVGAGETDALLAFMNLAITSESDSLTQAVLAKSWVQDGLNSNELHTVRQLTSLAKGSDGQSGTPADKIINMPFLDAVDAADAAAIEALGTWFWSTAPPSIDRVLSHPTLSGGITDDHTVMVAMSDMIVDSRPELLQTILDSELVTIEERLIQTTYSGEMLVAVLVTEPGVQLRTIEILAQVVRHHGEFMQVPYPRGYVMLLVAKASDIGAGGGPRGFMTIHRGLEREAKTIAQLTAFQYWPFAPAWISQGAAKFMESKYGGPSIFILRKCTNADNLSGLDTYYRDEVASGGDVDAPYTSGCAYSFGYRLFESLYDSLGDAEFRSAFTRLYLSLRDGSHSHACTVAVPGICYVRSAFVDEAESEESAAIAERIIDHWYDGPGQTESP